MSCDLVVYCDDRFDRAGGGVGEFVEPLRDLGDIEAVGDPVLEVDFSVIEDLDNLREVGGVGVPAGDDAELAAVEERSLGKREVLSGDPDIDDTASDGGIFMALDHRASVAGGIDDDITEASLRDFFNLLHMGAILLRLDLVMDAKLVLTEIESVLGEVDDDGFNIHELEELKAGEADGARADHHDCFTWLRISTFYSVVTDGEGLDEGELIIGEFVSGMEFVSGDDPVRLAKAAGLMDADDLDLWAGI